LSREVFLTIRGERHDFRRAVAQDDTGFNIQIQRRRHKRLSKRCFRNLLKGLIYMPWVIIADGLPSEGLPSGRSCPASSIGNIALSTIGPRMPTN
jgi:transposase-like protein